MPDDYKGVRKVLWITLFLNLLVVVFKIIFGLIVNSLAMVADGLHSLMDGVSNIVCLVGLSIARKPADRNHPYGHKKFETMTTIVIALFLLITSVELLESALKRMFAGEVPNISVASFAVLLSTLAVNIFVTVYEKHMGQKYHSQLLVADSMHTRSDVWVTISVIFSFVFVKLGFAFADPVLALVIACLIAYSGFKIIKGTAGILTDSMSIKDNEIRDVVKDIEYVTGVHKIRTRSSGNDTYLDLHIMVNGRRSVHQGHMTAKHVESVLKKRYPYLADITIHVDPTHKVVKP
jgi:cation diffusion facilitator family transporter